MSGLSALTGPLLALLAGGLAASLGVTVWSRTGGARVRLTATSGWTLAMGALLATLVGAAAGWWTVRPFLAPDATDPALPGPVGLFVVGVLVGLPLALPSVFVAWRDARTREATRRIRASATKDDRRAYAEDLLRQIQDASPEPRELTARIGGDGGTVLIFEGRLDGKEGARLTAALRTDLKEMGFKRVEGTGGGKGWWERV